MSHLSFSLFIISLLNMTLLTLLVIHLSQLKKKIFFLEKVILVKQELILRAKNKTIGYLNARLKKSKHKTQVS